MTAQRLDVVIWLLVYGGMLAASLGIFVQRAHQPIGWTLLVCGGAAVAAGVVLFWVRSRIRQQE